MNFAKSIRKLSQRVREREALNPDIFVREGKSPADEDELWSEHEEKVESEREEAKKEKEAKDNDGKFVNDGFFTTGRALYALERQEKEIDILNNLEARVDELERIDHYRHRCEHCNGPAHKGGSDVS